MSHHPGRWRLLCKIEDIPDGGARGFAAVDREHRSIFAIRRGKMAFVYVNQCPHAGAELEYAQDRFLSRDGQRIICFAHSAQFAVETGACLGGPCAGLSLEAVPSRIEDGFLNVSRGAGRID